jgi:hypothetical protein
VPDFVGINQSEQRRSIQEDGHGFLAWAR